MAHPRVLRRAAASSVPGYPSLTARKKTSRTTGSRDRPSPAQAGPVRHLTAATRQQQELSNPRAATVAKSPGPSPTWLAKVTRSTTMPATSAAAPTRREPTMVTEPSGG